MSEKNKIRSRMKEVLAGLSKPIYEDYSYHIACKLYHQAEWEQARVIGITVSKQPEVDTYQIIRKAWEQGKQVAVPKCEPKEKRLTFRRLTSFSQLESVYFGLLEPIESLTEEVIAADIDLLIVPGLAFTRDGFRLGFGGGYYDRYLSGYTGKTVSLAFHQQIISTIPVEEYDLPVSQIITDNEVIQIK